MRSAAPQCAAIRLRRQVQRAPPKRSGPGVGKSVQGLAIATGVRARSRSQWRARAAAHAHESCLQPPPTGAQSVTHGYRRMTPAHQWQHGLALQAACRGPGKATHPSPCPSPQPRTLRLPANPGAGGDWCCYSPHRNTYLLVTVRQFFRSDPGNIRLQLAVCRIAGRHVEDCSRARPLDARRQPHNTVYCQESGNEIRLCKESPGFKR